MFIRLALFCSALLAAAPASAAPWYQDWEGIRKAAATVTTIETDFVQTKALKILTKPLVSKGVMAYRRPNDLRWEYTSPLQTLLVVRRGNAQRLLKHGGEWVTDSSAKIEAMKIVLGEISLWLEGNFGASKTFRPELRQAAGGQQAHVELVPIEPALAKIISRIDIVFGERPGTVKGIDIYEGSENVTHIAFENSRFDGTIPDSRFEAPR